MTASGTNPELGDSRDRQRAIATFDRNLVVTAGAGTGKTTLLVDRLMHLILRDPEPLRITEIVALTFTNKAADEMKQRLRRQLEAYLSVELDRTPATATAQSLKIAVEETIARYRLSKDDLDRRVREALRHLERSDIGTIHSFAAGLLRLYPLEAGVDPQFVEDEGAAFDRLFDESWETWLDQELALDSPHAGDWLALLPLCPLDLVKTLARSLASETVRLSRERDNGPAIAPALYAWLLSLETRAAALIERHPEERINKQLVHAALAIFGAFRRHGGPGADLVEESARLTGKTINRSLQGWSAEDLADVGELVRAARGLTRVDEALVGRLWSLLAPFAEGFRERFIREGHISFDGLLVRARNLVRDHPQVRDELKRRYRAILIDEFQDTDPIQYEILLYLAEQHGAAAADWRRVKLAPGKIFVVGDPKQSIYSFRRADIEAYLEVVEKIIKSQDGVECRLTTNFRSNAEILGVVNGVFARLIRFQDGIQPSYIAIHPAPGRVSAPGGLPKVLVRRIVSQGENIDAEDARRREGENLARWLQERVIGKTAILNSAGETVTAQPKDIAILLRKLTHIHDYLEPLRRRGIRYVVEGERHFYAAKEIIDAVNLLRAVENPHDRMALVGVLRSPLGGLTDQEIYELHRRRLLSYRAAPGIDDKTLPAAVGDLYAVLSRLHDETARLPLGAAVAEVFRVFPVEMLAACYFHGEQAVANLEKLRQQADLLGRESLTTLKGAIRQLERRVVEVKEEGESALAEENLDALRIMSIHKSKGLEFPVVILAGCHSGTEGPHGAAAESLFDWSTGLAGTRLGRVSDLSGLYVSEKMRLRNIEEQKRLLYVAMTRARENLVISCAPTGRHASGSFLSMLDAALDGAIGDAQEPKILCLDEGRLEIELVAVGRSAPGGRRGGAARSKEEPDWRPFLAAWSRRQETYEKIRQSKLFLNPTSLKQQEEAATEAGGGFKGRQAPQTVSLAVGNLAHRLLQDWPFSGDTASYRDKLRDLVNRTLPVELAPERRIIEAELQEIFSRFFASAVYAELAAARILGREVPLLMPWNGGVMEGVIDLIYERNGLLYLADYKTDKVSADQLAQTAARYRGQAEIYSRSVQQGLGREIAAFKVIFLRLGAAVELGGNKSNQLSLF